MRTIIEVPKQVIRDLDNVGRQQKKSRAAIIREAIQLYLSEKTCSDSQAAFGIWESRKKDGLKYQEQIRSEWE